MSAPWWLKEPTTTKMGYAEYTTITTLTYYPQQLLSFTPSVLK